MGAERMTDEAADARSRENAADARSKDNPADARSKDNPADARSKDNPGNGDVSALIDSLTREVADFPEPGIQFKDLTPVLADAKGLAAVTDALAEIASGADLVAGIDARGFLLGGAVATRLGIGVLAVRKGGKLPPPVHSETYTLEYGTATLEVPADGLDIAGRKIMIIDDVLATGGTLAATARLLTAAGATLVGAAVVLELAALGGRAGLEPLQVTSLRRI